MRPLLFKEAHEGGLSIERRLTYEGNKIKIKSEFNGEKGLRSV